MTVAGGEYDLFGTPIAPLKPREQPRPPINDMDLIEDVLTRSSADGFVLIGIREDVFKRTTGDWVEKVPPDVDFAVHQLIEGKWLHVGGSHMVRYDRYTGWARSVLVPRKSKDKVNHWKALQRPPHWNRDAQHRSA